MKKWSNFTKKRQIYTLLTKIKKFTLFWYGNGGGKFLFRKIW